MLGLGRLQIAVRTAVGVSSIMACLAAPTQAQQRQAQPPPAQQAPPPAAQPAAPPPLAVVEVNQTLLDRWLVFYVDFVPKLLSGKLPESQIGPTFERACRAAGLANIPQCEALDRYLAALLGGAQQESQSFVNPRVKLQKDLATLAADKNIPADQKAAEKADIEEFLASLPARIPEAHIALMNQNAKRVFEAMAKIPPPAPPPGAQPPPGPAPGPPPGQKR